MYTIVTVSVCMVLMYTIVTVSVCMYTIVTVSGCMYTIVTVSVCMVLLSQVNIVPVIAKADTMTPEECKEFKKKVNVGSHDILLCCVHARLPRMACGCLVSLLLVQ